MTVHGTPTADPPRRSYLPGDTPVPSTWRETPQMVPSSWRATVDRKLLTTERTSCAELVFSRTGFGRPGGVSDSLIALVEEEPFAGGLPAHLVENVVLQFLACRQRSRSEPSPDSRVVWEVHLKR